MKIKQLTLLVMILGLSGAAVARNSTSAAEPESQSKWSVGGDAIYGETGHDNSVYASGPTTASPQTQFVADRDAEWGFKVWAGYDMGNGITKWIDWLRFHNDGKTSSTPPGGIFSSVVTDGDFSQLTGRQASDFDQVTLQMAHTFKNNNGINVKAHVGLQMVLLDATNTYGGTFTPGIPFNFEEKSEFDGGGVVAGVDLERMCGNTFSIFSRNQVGLAYGKLDTKAKAAIGSGSDRLIEKKNSVVPTINAELGAAYNMELASMDLRFEAGVRGTVIVDGVQNFVFTSDNPSDDRYNWTEASIFFGGQVAFSNLAGIFG